MCILEEQETYLLRAFLIVGLLWFGGSLCWNIPTKSQQQGMIRISKKILVKLKGQNQGSKSRIDMDEDGRVDWNEFALYLKWAIRQYPQTKTAEELLSIAFRKGIIPAMQDVVILQNTEKRIIPERPRQKQKVKKTPERISSLICTIT